MAVGILELLWHFTAEFAPQGNIGKFSDYAIAKAVGWEKHSGKAGVTTELWLSSALVTSKWLEPHSIHRLIVHDWPDHSDQSVARKLARQKLDFVQPETSQRLAVPLPEPMPYRGEPEPDSQSPSAAPRSDISPPLAFSPSEDLLSNGSTVHRSGAKEKKDENFDRFAAFDKFWELYPRHVSKAAARKAFGRQIKTMTAFERAMEALGHQRPAMMLNQSQFRPHPATWLNQERWDDEDEESPGIRQELNGGELAVMQAQADYEWRKRQ